MARDLSDIFGEKSNFRHDPKIVSALGRKRPSDGPKIGWKDKVLAKAKAKVHNEPNRGIEENPNSIPQAK